MLGPNDYNVYRLIDDGMVYDYTFYIFLSPTASNSQSTVIGPYQILKIPYCEINDVTPTTTYPDLNFEAGSGSGFTDVSDQNFMSAISSC